MQDGNYQRALLTIHFDIISTYAVVWIAFIS